MANPIEALVKARWRHCSVRAVLACDLRLQVQKALDVDWKLLLAIDNDNCLEMFCTHLFSIQCDDV